MDKRNVDIVLVRMDKIGDLVLSLPVDEHPIFRGPRVTWFISKGLGFIADQAVPKRASVEFKRSVFELPRMVNWLKRQNPRSIVIMHAPWWVSFAAWLADVPERIGRRSQWHSFFFLNVPVRQKRSLADRHESDFNFDLVELAFHRLGHRRTWNLKNLKESFLRLLPPNPIGTLERRGLKHRGYRVVHPGMAGSALNWPQSHYVELIEKLAEEMPVLITGTAMDKKYLREVSKVKGRPNVEWLVGELKTSELLDLLSQARSVIAPSTGVVHLAASLDTPTVGIYSPRKVEHPRRWGPKGLAVTYLVPPVNETEMIHPDVMKQITVDEVYQAVIELERGDGSKARTPV